MNAMYNYKIYGFNVITNIELGLPNAHFDMHDITVMKVDLNTYLELKRNEKSANEICLANEIKFLIVNHNDIYTNINDEADLELMKLFLLGSVFSYILIHREIFSIHGCGISINESAIVFAGEPGVGKSSIARGMINKGYRIFSDDVSIISADFKVIPSYPSQKLWKDTMDSQYVEYNDALKVINKSNKYKVSVEESFMTKPEELIAVIFLEIKEGIKKPVLEKINGRNIIQNLIEDTYRYEFIDSSQLLLSHFMWVTSIYNNCLFYTLQRPSDSYTVDKQVELIEEEFSPLKLKE